MGGAEKDLHNLYYNHTTCIIIYDMQLLLGYLPPSVKDWEKSLREQRCRNILVYIFGGLLPYSNTSNTLTYLHTVAHHLTHVLKQHGSVFNLM